MVLPGADEPTYSLGAVARMTGLNPATLRAWERRYQAVSPLRTDGGTRRYREADVERLRLLAAAVRAGHRIGDVAALDDAALRARADATPPVASAPIDEILDAFDRLDATESEERLSFQLSALGPLRFVRDIAHPLLVAIGGGWAEGRVSIAAEHLATAQLRSLLGAALRPRSRLGHDLRIVFATPPGERHELGLLSAALAAVSLGVEAIYLGADLPIDEIAAAVDITGARAVAISIVQADGDETIAAVSALRDAIPGAVEIWLGGGGASELDLPDGVSVVTTLDAIEARVALLLERRD